MIRKWSGKTIHSCTTYKSNSYDRWWSFKQCNVYLNYSWFLNDMKFKNPDYKLSLRTGYLFLRNILVDSIRLLSSVRWKSVQAMQDFGKSSNQWSVFLMEDVGSFHNMTLSSNESENKILVIKIQPQNNQHVNFQESCLSLPLYLIFSVGFYMQSPVYIYTKDSNITVTLQPKSD